MALGQPSPPFYPGPYTKPKPFDIRQPKAAGIGSPSFAKPGVGPKTGGPTRPAIPSPGGDGQGGFGNQPLLRAEQRRNLGRTTPSLPFPPGGGDGVGLAAGGGTPTPPFYPGPPPMNPNMQQMFQHRMGGGNIPPWLMNDPRWAIIRQRLQGAPGGTPDPYMMGGRPFGPPPPPQTDGEMWPNFGGSVTRPYISPQQVLNILMGIDSSGGDAMQPPRF